MEERIRGYVEGVFRNAPRDARTRVVVERIAQKLIARYRALCGDGMDAAEACERVIAENADLSGVAAQVARELDASGESADADGEAPEAADDDADDGDADDAPIEDAPVVNGQRAGRVRRRGSIWLILAIVAAAALASQLIFSSGGVVSSLVQYSYEDAASYRAGTASLKGVREVEIEWVSGAVSIQPCAGDETRFEEHSDAQLSSAQQLRWRQDGDKLYIRYAAAGNLGLNFPEKTLTLSLPEAVEYHEIDVDVVSARLELGALNARALNLETVSGAIRLNGCHGEQLDIDSVSGAVRGEALDFVQVDAETVSGEAELRFAGTTRLNSVDFESVSGDITLALPEALGFSARMDAASGDFHSELSCSYADKRYLHGDGAAQIEVESVSGDLNLLAAD